ncbi:hypothetical protein [Spirillospora sp. NPDC047279]
MPVVLSALVLVLPWLVLGSIALVRAPREHVLEIIRALLPRWRSRI